MTAPRSELWGQQVYGDKTTPVPLVAARCKSQQSRTSKAHVCKQHHAHYGDHCCICGAKWTAGYEAVSS